jgi:hypothetical protein
VSGRGIKIADSLTLPLDAVTQTIGVLAKRRAGKSYAARRLAEQLFQAGQQVVIVDPKGDWWGVRSSADGRAPGFPFVILGGEHADVPLEVSAGEVVARLVVEERVSALLDLSLLRKREVAAFMAAFLERLYRLKAHERFRDAMMLVIDEADAVGPQKPMTGEERMLGAAEDIVRRGGQRGIGCTMVTQRSAVLNKNLLTQCQILMALRTIAPQDLAALDAWIDAHGTQEQRRTLMSSLPSLPVGDAWVWSPGWPTEVGIFQRVHVLPIDTFDSGSTPRPGERRREPKTVAHVDLDALRRQMAETMERAKADDPRELRRQIADLQKQLKIASKPAPAPVPVVERVEVSVLREQDAKRLEAAANRIGGAASSVLEATRGVLAAIAAIGKVATPQALARPMVPRAVVPTPTVRPDRVAPPRQRAEPVASANGLPVGERKILAAAAQYPAGVTREQLSILAGYKRSTRDTYVQRLRERGFVEVSGALILATADGVEALGHDFEPLPTGDELLTHWLDRLPDGEARILRCVASAYPGAVLRAALDDATGFKRSTRDTYLQRLGVRKLVESVGGGEVRAAPELFG